MNNGDVITEEYGSVFEWMCKRWDEVFHELYPQMAQPIPSVGSTDKEVEKRYGFRSADGVPSEVSGVYATSFRIMDSDKVMHELVGRSGKGWHQ